MGQTTKVLTAAGLAMVMAAGLVTPTGAGAFYSGKQLTILINFSTGSATDIEARLFARHIGGHIAGNPQVIVRNMAGGHGTVAANHLGRTAPPDGGTIGYFTATGWAQAFKPLNDSGLRLRLGEFGLVATQAGTSIAYMRTDVAPGLKKPADIMNTGGFTVAGLGAMSSLDIRERLVLDMLGVTYGYVTGYRRTSKARTAVAYGEVHYLSEYEPSFRARVLPALVETGVAIPLFYYPYDDGTTVRDWPDVARGLNILPFHEFYQKVKGRKPSGMLWKAFRQVNRAAGMVQRAILLPPKSPQAALASLRKAVVGLNRDPEYARDAMKTVAFVPRFEVGPAAESLMKASTRLTPDVVRFLRDYIAKVARTRS